MKKVSIFLVIGFLVLCNCISFSWGMAKKKEVNQYEKQIEKEKQELLSYEDYTNIFTKVWKKLKVKGYQFKDGSITPCITLVERDLTFDSRKVLNTTDVFDTGEDNTTQRMLIYENPARTKQIHVILSYIPENLKSDMINCYEMDEFKKGTKALGEKMCIATVNYKNVIISITQVSTEKASVEDNFTFIREIQKLL